MCLLVTLFFCAAAQGEWHHEEVVYNSDDTYYRGHLIYKESAARGGNDLPGILMVPNWMGPDTAATLEKAKAVAGDKFAVFIADMYGMDVRPTDAEEAGAAAGLVRSDRELMRTRAAKAIEVFAALAHRHPFNPDKILGIGFCFGGGTLLEYARSGSEKLAGIVSFHGDLASPTLAADSKKVRTPLLVLHGADDPFVPQKDVNSFIHALQAGGVDDWTLVQFSGAVHSFTDPTAASEGARYHPRSAERAFAMMYDFAQEVLALDD